MAFDMKTAVFKRRWLQHNHKVPISHRNAYQAPKKHAHVLRVNKMKSIIQKLLKISRVVAAAAMGWYHLNHISMPFRSLSNLPSLAQTMQNASK